MQTYPKQTGNPKTAERTPRSKGREQARARLLETTKPRSPAELRVEAEAVGKRFRYVDPEPRYDLAIIGRIITAAARHAQRRPLADNVVEQLEAVLHALHDAGRGPWSLPSRQAMAVTVDGDGLHRLREAIRARLAVTVAAEDQELEAHGEGKNDRKVIRLADYRRGDRP